MSTIILAQYNNYYNRIIKQSTLDTFTSLSNVRLLPDINFNPHDGVTTRLVINWDGNFIPDYLVECDTDIIVSRWFITDMKRERSGQYTISLKRDLIADFYDETMNATTFISRGFLDSDNPLIFNPEGITVNQIKKSEHLLKDSTQCGWIVGYVAPDLGIIIDEEGVETDNPIDIDIEFSPEVVPDITTFPYLEYTNKTITGLINREWSKIYFETKNGYVSYYAINGSGAVYLEYALPDNTISLNLTSSEYYEKNINLNLPNDFFDPMVAGVFGPEELTDAYKYNNRVFNDNGVYKKVVIKSVPNPEPIPFARGNINQTNHAALYETIVNGLIENGIQILNQDNCVIPYELRFSSYQIILETIGEPLTKVKTTFKKTNKRLLDAPYKMFCMPISEEMMLYAGNNGFYINKERQLQIASSIATGLGSNLYDIQLLPYCPIEDKFFVELGALYYDGGTVDIDFTLSINAADEVKGIIFWCDYSNFTTNISDLGKLQDIKVLDPIEFKIGNETNYLRMVSPNYANFENINIYMNYGVDYINVDATYKPITPYIKLNINYKGLYGADFDDNRGLVLGGDFSLPIMSDAWVNYTIQNKNYANIFDRETQHLEYQHQWDMATTITGAISGTIMSGIMGGAIGGVGGAIGGAIGGAATGAMDIAATGAIHGEAMDYRKDMYKMNLQNIQALPQGLVKTSAFNYNSKIWPFLEFYSCTDTEKELLRNKIKYTGMKVEAIGKISDYLNPADQTYIQGNLIRINIDDDYHMAQALNQELNIGVYI